MARYMPMLESRLSHMVARVGFGLALLLVIAGCSSPTLIRQDPPAPVPSAARPAQPSVTTHVADNEPTEPSAAPQVPDPKPERRLIPREPLQAQFSRGLDFPDCAQLDARATRWLATLRKQRKAFKDDLSKARPLLDLAARHLEEGKLPIAFALLPMIESRYFPHPGKASGPAGIWQLMPVTARGLAVPMIPGYDGRLDFLRSTRAATELLIHLAGQFDHDWRLVNMAFNAGEFRVKKAMRKSKLSPPIASIESLGLSKITLHHLARLEAWACMLEQEPDLLMEDSVEPLMAVSIEAPIRLDFLAFLAGIDIAALRRWNPALRSDRIPALESFQILLPLRSAHRTEAMLSKLPSTSWARWQRVSTLVEPASIHRRYGALADAIIELNEIDGDKVTAKARPLWVPLNRQTTSSPLAKAGAALHTVRAGDSLWKLASQYGIALKGLMQWNGLTAKSILRPGQVLRLRPP